MDMITMLFIASMGLGLVFNAMKFMRFINSMSRAGRVKSARGYDDQRSFDDRLAERLRELERDRK